MKIDILLATYNGAKYLEQLLDSLCKQTFSDWRLLIRDDGSQDCTITLIKKNSEKDFRITLIEDNCGNLGVSGNFAKLLSLSSAPLIMFADQDDVWIPEKIQLLVKHYLSLNPEDMNIPLLIHCDALITGENLIPTGQSFLQKRGAKIGIKHMIFTGFVQGASMMINNHLKNFVNPLPDNVMYDYYIALVCEIVGKRKLVDVPCMYYRMHNSNAIGRSAPSLSEKIFKLFNSDFKIAGKKEISTLKTFQTNFKDKISSKDVELLTACYEIAEKKGSKLNRLFKTLVFNLNSDGSSINLALKILLQKRD